ncbi:MAG: glycosyl hydrolase 53 family protein [Calditrichaeota bacterium]|nr:glycosyl hydrolase 53 family protein [Calditrichota bacterium]
MAALLLFCVTSLAQPLRWACDLSFVPKLEYNGAIYSRDGIQRTGLEVFRAAGFDVLRVRLWHTPTESWQGIDSVLAFAQRADILGYKILLDIHYSDTWADPAHQTKPLAWQSLSYVQLLDSMYFYTNNVVRRFRDADVVPEFVQIGNEIGAGFLWDTGRVGGAWDTPQQWTQLASLLDTAAAGVRDSLPEAAWPKIILHHQEGGNFGACQWFFEHLDAEQVDYDIIGLSYYPWWHGSLDDLSNNLENLYTEFGKEVYIVETAYPWMTGWCDDTGNIVGDQTSLLPAYPATEAGQASYFSELAQRLLAAPHDGGPLLCPWEPAWIPTNDFGSAWENLAFFDCDGNALTVFSIFPGLAPAKLTVAVIGSDVELRWPDDANPFYKLYASNQSGGPYGEFLGSTSNRTWLLTGEVEQHSTRYFVVTGSPTP